MPDLYPLRFEPIYRQYIWGGHRLRTLLDRPLRPEQRWAESWELVDHDADQSRVEAGPLAGATLHELMLTRRQDLLGPRELGTLAEPLRDRFSLLVKFLDAEDRLSLQVHPNDRIAAQLTPPDLGKTEAWVVLAAEPESVIYAGLKPGVDRKMLAKAIDEGACHDCLHTFHPKPGDCLFIPAGTVHSMGGGVLVAEIQQASDATFRLFDWNRLGSDGKPRPLHIRQALDAVNYHRGPLQPHHAPANYPDSVSVLAQCDQFVLESRRCASPQPLGAPDRFHIITVLEGALQLPGDPASGPLPRGRTALLPAALGQVEVVPKPEALILDIYPPSPKTA